MCLLLLVQGEMAVIALNVVIQIAHCFFDCHDIFFRY